jgi:hypothetical protein
VLANQLVPRLEELIHVMQSAFMKGQYIQDNFRYVQTSAKLLHARSHSSLLLKVDISRAFDSVCWSFLLDVMTFVGFPAVWREWIAVLLSSASMRIQLNGAQGDRICHAFASGRSVVAHDVSVGDGGAKYPLPQSRLLGLVVKVAETPDPVQGVYVRR